MRLSLISLYFIFNIGYSQNILFEDTLLLNSFTIIPSDTVLHCNEIYSVLKFYHLNYFIKDSIDKYISEKSKKEILADQLVRGELVQYQKYRVIPNLLAISNDSLIFYADIAYNIFEKNKYIGIANITRYTLIRENNFFKIDFDFSKKMNVFLSKDKLIKYFTLNDSISESTMSIIENGNELLAQIFHTKKIKFDYYNFHTIESMHNSIGFLYKRHSSSWINYGYADIINSKIYLTGNVDEGHELCHLYVYNRFGANVNQWFNEGFATLLFGSIEEFVEKDFIKLKKDLKEHPEYNLNNLLFFDKTKIDLNTNYLYTIGALFCKLAHAKNGYNGIFNLLSYGNSDSDFYKALENELGIKQENLNEFIRKELEKY